MKLSRIAGLLDRPPPQGPDIEINDIHFDSREVVSGSLFFCVPGHHVDGARFASDAIASGASALVCKTAMDLRVPQIVVDDPRAAMGQVAPEFFENPTKQIMLVGVTGTNGKTTTVFMLEQIFKAAGLSCGLMSTILRRWGAVTEPAPINTPESIDLHRTFSKMAAAGVKVGAMEVTSEGIAMGRLTGCHFATGIFTNLTQDHLNFHGSMENYFAAKKTLFTDMARTAVINIDDEWGARLLQDLEELECKPLTFGIDAGDFRATGLELDLEGSSFEIRSADLSLQVTTRMPGRYNVMNAVGASVAAHAMGIGPESIVKGIEALDVVPGRFQKIDEGQDFAVVVDYAHTPDALASVLVEARHVSNGRVVVVFGCGGDRDPMKRPIMGKIAGTNADVVIVTSDNPRHEDPIQIIKEIEVGLAASGASFYQMIEDRADAIRTAVATAASGDVIVIAGKGHEPYQQIGDVKHDFDDAVVAAKAIRERS